MSYSAAWKAPANMKRADLFSICGINVAKGRVTGTSSTSLTSVEVFWFLPGFLLFQLPISSNWELQSRQVSVSLSFSSASKGGGGQKMGAGAPGQKLRFAGVGAQPGIPGMILKC